MKAKCILLYEDLHVIAEQQELSQGYYLKEYIPSKLKGAVLEGTSQIVKIVFSLKEKIGFRYM